MPTETQRKALARAADRPNGSIIPTPGLRGAAETAVLRSLERHGWAEPKWCGLYITDAGRDALLETD